MAVAIISGAHRTCMHQSRHMVHSELNGELSGSAAAPATPCPAMGQSNLSGSFRLGVQGQDGSCSLLGCS